MLEPNYSYRNIRIHRECGIEKCVPGIYALHHKACRVMTNSDREGQIFLSHPHTNNGFFFLLIIKYRIFILEKRIQEVPEYAEMRHITMTSL